jgi:hypothetical protein
MTAIRRLVLDVLKPHDPPVRTVAQAVAACDGVSGVNVVLVEIDREVENVKLTVEGSAVDYDAVVDTLTDLGASVHSVDEFACGERLVESSQTPQD